MNKAEFLWPHDDGSVEALGYELANALTEEYRKQAWDALTTEMRKQTLLRASEIADNISSQYGDGDAIGACDAISEAILKEAGNE